MSTLLVLDSNNEHRRRVARHFRTRRWDVHDVATLRSASEVLERISVDVMVADAVLEDGPLAELLRTREEQLTPVVWIVTADASSTQEAVRAIQHGAYDLLHKPYLSEELEHKLHRAVEYRRLQHETQSLRGERDIIYRPENFVGESGAIRSVIDMISRVSSSDASVLLTGETGTGKELVAGALHYNSERAGRAFIKVNCAALPDQLLESELFGHEKGAFTGAYQQRIGRFEQADGGSLFLDEVADMSGPTQAKVLRVIQEKEFERLGGSRTIKTDVRLISATNKDLEEEMVGGRFRQDLYYRLNVIAITIPPLRDRQRDIVPLSRFFLSKLSADLKKPVKRLHPLAVELLREHSWPGNVRELQNTIERAVIMAEGDEISVNDLDIAFRKRRVGEATSDDPNVIHISPAGFNLTEVEKGYILQALRICDWVQKDAAKLLGISPRALNYKIKKHGIVITKS